MSMSKCRECTNYRPDETLKNDDECAKGGKKEWLRRKIYDIFGYSWFPCPWFKRKPAPPTVEEIIVVPAEQPPVDILPETGVVYNNGDKTHDKGPEIWQHNWHTLNVRLYNNGGHPKEQGIAQGSQWYPIDHAVMPEGTVTLTKTETGCTATAKDFTAKRGQKYRFLGWWADGTGKLHRNYSVDLTTGQMHGALIGNWGSYK
jgi:hypothetical protein